MEKQLAVKKKVFWEARDAATCDGMLRQYQSHISRGQDAGALLVCVVGAKLSEGTGFILPRNRCFVCGLIIAESPDNRQPRRLQSIQSLRRALSDSAQPDCTFGLPVYALQLRAAMSPLALNMHITH